MKKLKGDQPKAFEKLKMFYTLEPGGSMFLLQGFAGTGKTFLIAEWVEFLKQTTKAKILVTAPTNKAVKVLNQFVDNVNSMTTHAALAMTEHIDGYGTQTFKRNKNKIAPAVDYNLIIVDEASMIADDLFMELVPLQELGIKILFVGDPMQIPPVNHDSSMPMSKDIRQDYSIDTIALREIIRQEEGNPIIELSFMIRKAIFRPIPVIDRLGSITPLGKVSFVQRSDEAALFSEILPIFKSDEFSKDPDRLKVIAWTNKTVNRYNDVIRDAIFQKDSDKLPKIIKGDKLIADTALKEDKRVMINTNEEMEVLEVSVDTQTYDDDWVMKYYKCIVQVQRAVGDYSKYVIKIIHEDSESLYKEILNALKTVAKNQRQGGYEARQAWIQYYDFINSWHRVKYNYAITAHKSQGSTYKQAVVLEYDIELNRGTFEKNRVLYTACTRPSTDLTVVYNPLT